MFAGRKMTREETRELEKKKEVLRLARDYNATTVDKSQRCVVVSALYGLWLVMLLLILMLMQLFLLFYFIISFF